MKINWLQLNNLQNKPSYVVVFLINLSYETVDCNFMANLHVICQSRWITIHRYNHNYIQHGNVLFVGLGNTARVLLNDSFTVWNYIQMQSMRLTYKYYNVGSMESDSSVYIIKHKYGNTMNQQLVLQNCFQLMTCT